MDAAADDGMQLWTALKREIDITRPRHDLTQKTSSRPRLNKSMTKAVAEFGLRFRGAYANSRIAARHQRIALELVTDLDHDDDNAIIIPDIIRRTNERASLHDRIIRANPENRRRRLALPVQGRGGGRNGGRTGGEEAATPNVSTRGDTTDAAKMQTVQLHTLTTLRCVMRLAARVTTQHVGAATPTRPRRSRWTRRISRWQRRTRRTTPAADTPQPQHYTPQQHQNFQQLGGAYTTYPAYPVLATDASHHGIGGTQQYLPPPPPLPSRLMQNNIARVGEAFPTMNAPPPTGQMYQTGPYRLSNAYYGFYFGQIDVETAYLYALNEIWILVYVDDIIFASKNEQTKDILAGHLRKKYELPNQTTDMGTRNEDIVRARWHHPHSRSLHERRRGASPRPQFVGAILYAAVISRPDLSSTVRAMSHVMSKPPSNFEACKKHVLRYLSGTINRGIKYNTNSNVPLKLIGYCDASWGDNHENRRSTSGYIFFLNGGPISWASYLQTTVALSTVESEVMALTEAIKEAIYIPEALVDHPTSHRRTKHIEIRREFIKFHIGHETVKIERVSTKDQLADIMTKPLRQDIHNYLVQMILHG
ncbi:retrovirus-related Pol polyprotein [Pseudoscourfieldia marina]